MVTTPLPLKVTWQKLPDDYVLPDDPVDNINQPPLAAALT
ncbi:MAG: Uma2 family endonuclease, partial [Spirulinaceae cyanobacterium SM2_1_0]|nr:Uma2 family endonuclease [Spirulinaceae cyanobacterium SM2_1_0]